MAPNSFPTVTSQGIRVRILRTETSQYALLLVILFAIATIAVRETIVYFEPRLPTPEFQILVAKLWSLSLGFMLIAGAFGLLGIRLAAETEGPRRVGRVVDAMDYIHDGMLLLNRRGHITGSNPEARQMASTTLDAHTPLQKAFPCLSSQDAGFLLDREEPHEIERPLGGSAFAKTLRFRSQPSANLSLVLICDVTAMRRRRLRRRRSARLQLIGQIAKGVTNDFNELLCAIAGNASVLPRLATDSDDARQAIAAIERSAEKGVALAAHLGSLADTGNPHGNGNDMTPEHVRAAADMLRDNLTDEWTVECSVAEGLAAVALGRSQVEQLVLNLGLLVADAMAKPGTIAVSLLPSESGSSQTDDDFACVLHIGGEDASRPLEQPATPNGSKETTGVILSVIRSMLEETGSKLESLTTHRGTPLYRVLLAQGQSVSERHGTAAGIPEELSAYIAHWSIVVAKHERSYAELDARLLEIGANVQRVHDIMSALGRLDSDETLDAMIVDENLLGPESRALVRAMLKIRPATALVVLGEDDTPKADDLTDEVVLVPAHASSDRILMALIDARRMAVRRKSTEAT